jgi:hypothetical protein
MKDRRVSAPLGSTMVAELQRHFLLAVDPRPQRQGEAGTWLAGKRKPGLDTDDPDLPVADRVEVFVRAADLALVSMRQLLGEQAVQTVTVEALQRDPELGGDAFVVAAPVAGGKPKPVQQFAPLWESIQQACLDAEAKVEKAAAARNKDVPEGQQTSAEVRPSKR